ncbi:MAG: hypothetical protein ACK4UN_02025, partial [Limisphaerales bacterium]
MNGLILILLGAGTLAAAYAFVANWFALAPWRRVKREHWSEQARVYHPARVAASGNLWAMPAAFTMAIILIAP